MTMMMMMMMMMMMAMMMMHDDHDDDDDPWWWWWWWWWWQCKKQVVFWNHDDTFSHATWAKSSFRYSGMLIFCPYNVHFLHGREKVGNPSSLGDFGGKIRSKCRGIHGSWVGPWLPFSAFTFCWPMSPLLGRRKPLQHGSWWGQPVSSQGILGCFCRCWKIFVAVFVGALLGECQTGPFLLRFFSHALTPKVRHRIIFSPSALPAIFA